jgi:hypothetical protein
MTNLIKTLSWKENGLNLVQFVERTDEMDLSEYKVMGYMIIHHEVEYLLLLTCNEMLLMGRSFITNSTDCVTRGSLTT